jgi:hypothetical protein
MTRVWRKIGDEEVEIVGVLDYRWFGGGNWNYVFVAKKGNVDDWVVYLGAAPAVIATERENVTVRLNMTEAQLVIWTLEHGAKMPRSWADDPTLEYRP